MARGDDEPRPDDRRGDLSERNIPKYVEGGREMYRPAEYYTPETPVRPDPAPPNETRPPAQE